MELGDLGKEFCVKCGQSYLLCECGLGQLGFKVLSADEVENYFVPLVDNVTYTTIDFLTHERQAFDRLYSTLLEVGNIIQRGIRQGERGYKKALHDAMEKLREVQ